MMVCGVLGFILITRLPPTNYIQEIFLKNTWSDQNSDPKKDVGGVLFKNKSTIHQSIQEGDWRIGGNTSKIES